MAPLRTLLLALAALTPWVAAPAVASADPKPGIGQAWPMCADDPDGRYCVISQTKDGVPITQPADGAWTRPYVDLIGDGDVRFGVYACPDPACNPAGGDVSPDESYVLVVNTGDIRTRELFGHIQDVDLSFGGDATDGYTFTLAFRPVPIAWHHTEPPAEWRLDCYVGACADGLVANLVYDGFVTGYLTDLAAWQGSVADERTLRTGFVHAYGAEDASQPTYDPATNSLVFQLANPHWRSPGVLAVETYETFLPNAMLTGLLQVPDPAALTGGSLAVTSSTAASVPVTLEHLPDGIRVRLTGLTFSSPTYRIRVRKLRPGAPRGVWSRRVTAGAMRVGFHRPLATGGSPILRYVARCAAPRRVASATGRRSPIVVPGLVRGVRYRCAVRAVNAVGAGRYSTSTPAR